MSVLRKKLPYINKNYHFPLWFKFILSFGLLADMIVMMFSLGYLCSSYYMNMYSWGINKFITSKHKAYKDV